jgi:hypothetical protein
LTRLATRTVYLRAGCVFDDTPTRPATPDQAPARLTAEALR